MVIGAAIDMPKILHVGDPHVKNDNLEESVRLIDFAIQQAKLHNAELFLAGDQYDGHGIVQVPVLSFWMDSYKKIKQANVRSKSLIGNHDLTTDFKHSPMYVHTDETAVIDRNGYIDGKVGFIGFIKKNDEFIAKANEMYREGIRIIFCHAEFDGAKFESGMFCPNGIPLDVFPSDLLFISGHIHDKQFIRNNAGIVRVIYPGTPRMLTRSDFGRKKALMLIDTDTLEFTQIDIPVEVSEPFNHIIVESLEDLSKIYNSERLYVDVKGSKEFIESILKQLPEKVKARSIPDRELAPSSLDIAESEGMVKSFKKYVDRYCTENELGNSFASDLYKYLPGWSA
jgi:DNA repair exonuclease SbcCD nuclease subunit